MDLRARKQYLEALLERYLKARKRHKGALLDEICRTTRQNRKYVIRKLSDLAAGKTRLIRKRKAACGRDVQRGLETLWAIFDFPCGQRLRPLIRTELEKLRRFGEISVSPAGAISVTTCFLNAPDRSTSAFTFSASGKCQALRRSSGGPVAFFAGGAPGQN